MDALMSASTPPLTLRRLDDVERRLKDVIFKQKDAKERSLQAQNEMREMLAAFIDRLSQMAVSSGVFHEKLESSARQIEQAKTLAEIAPVLKDVVGATKTMAHDSLSVRDDRAVLELRQFLTIQFLNPPLPRAIFSPILTLCR